MEAKCTEIIEKITSSYEVDEEFQEFVDYGIDDDTRYFNLDVYHPDEEESIANLTLGIDKKGKMVDIVAVTRNDNAKYKGVGRDLIYLAACKAIQLDYPLKFKATPYSESDGLFKYYNSLGFSRKGNIRGQGRNRGLNYLTTPETLRKIISKVGGKRKTRKRAA
jgi:hypothetical protein